MDGQLSVVTVVSIVCSFVGGWELRSHLTREPQQPVCHCGCHCTCESAFSFGTLCIVSALRIIGVVGCSIFGGLLISQRLEVSSGSSPTRGEKGVFGQTGKLSLQG